MKYTAILAAGFATGAFAVTTTLPEATGETTASEPISVSGEFDGEMQRFDRDREYLTTTHLLGCGVHARRC